MSQNQFSSPPGNDPLRQTLSGLDVAASTMVSWFGRSFTNVFHVVVVPDTGDPRLESFTTAAEWLEFVRSRLGEQETIYPLFGVPMGVTVGQFRYLVTPLGHLPLFAAPLPDEDLQTDNYMGTRLSQPTVPTEAEEQAALQAEVDAALEDFDEEEEDYE